MRKPQIIPVPKSADSDRVKFDAAIKERLEIISGERNSKIKALSSTATTAEIIDKINEIIGLLQ